MNFVNSEDAKLHTLAKSSLQRNKAVQCAALRDGTGRTHVGTSINMSSLKLDALEVALAMALSSGAIQIEAAVVLGDKPNESAPRNIREISPLAAIWYVNEDGSIHSL